MRAWQALAGTFLPVALAKVSTFFPSWGQYRNPPFTPNTLLPLLKTGKIDTVNYAFFYICPDAETSQAWIDQLAIAHPSDLVPHTTAAPYLVTKSNTAAGLLASPVLPD
jgi:GH18 family chitinase